MKWRKLVAVAVVSMPMVWFVTFAIGDEDKPRLVVRGPQMLMPTGYPPVATALIRAEIKGPITDEWNCPRVEFEWSDETRSSMESDCEPGETGETSWSRRVRLSPGRHRITVRLYKTNKLLALESITILVTGE
jgi:hypothetical protein